MSEPLALLWYWRYHLLDVEEFDSLDGALSAAEAWLEDGQAAADCIESWNADGEVLVLKGEPLDDAIMERHKARADEEIQRLPVPVVARLVIQPPEGLRGPATSEPFVSRKQAEEKADRLRPYLGGRVKVVPA